MNDNILTPLLATRIFVKGPLCPAAFRLIVCMEWTGVPGTLGVPTNMGASLGGCKVAVEELMMDMVDVVQLEVQGTKH